MALVHCAIIGCGRVAGHHIRAIKKLPGLKLVAVCDLIKERAEQLSLTAGVPFYTNYYEMLTKYPEINLVAIITPSGMHYEHALEIITQFNKHVLIEKPMVLRLSHGQALKEIGVKHKVHIFPVFQYRFNKCVQRVKTAIEKNELGKIFLATIRLRWCRPQSYYNRDKWRGTFALDGGTCTNQAIHHLDLLRYLVGDIQSVNARMSTFGAQIEVEDTATATLQFKNGVMGILEVTTAARPIDYESSISILGEKGFAMIGGGFTGDLIKFSPKPEDEITFSEKFPDAYGWGHETIYQGVLDTLIQKKQPAVDFNDAMKTIGLLHALYVSNENKEEIQVQDHRQSKRLGEEREELANLYRTFKQ